MVRRSKGLRSKSRSVFRKKPRERGLHAITSTLQEFEEGQYVNIKIDPGFHKGQPHKRFHGLTGKVVGKQGESYLVDTKVGNMTKKLVIRPEHLSPMLMPGN